MNKEILQNGDRVKFRNGEKGIFISGCFIGYDTYKIAELYDYDDDLTNTLEKTWDVIEISKPTYKTIAKREISKMTIEEIKEELGYDFDIVEK